jgi:glycosyltransferase involved in cell wall biosynthesis
VCAGPVDANASPVETALPSSAAVTDSYSSTAGRTGNIEPTLRAELPKISVIVPTFNRAEWLREAVQSLQSQVTGGLFTYEIVIIDNASTDATSQVASELADRSDVPIQYFYQPTPGDAPTRNMGICNSQGQWLAFFDDDQFADTTWLQELYRVASSTESSIVGGPVHLNLPEKQLDYLGPLCRKALREIAYYPTVHPYLKRHLPGTGNALVARSVFEDVGTFDETMTSGGSDHDFFLRARAARYPLWYAPRAIIRHRIPARRLTKAYFRWDALTGGAGHAAHLDYKRKGLAWTVMMCVARLGHAGLVTLPKLVVAWSRGDDGHVLGRQTVLWRAEGYARKTLALIAPWLFAQRRFFESLEFRNGRTIGQKTDAPAKERPQSIGADT